MTGVQLEFVYDEVKTEEGSPINRIYPKDSFDLFAGQQLVVVGRYRKPGVVKVIVQGMLGESRQKLDFPATLVDKSADESFGFIEKLWAVRRVGEILDELDLRGKNDELVKELVDLATKHGILTPYTSFMADDRANVHDLAGNVRRAGGRLEALSQSYGGGAFVQRDMMNSLKRADRAPEPAKTVAAFGGAAGPAATDLKFAGEAEREGTDAQRNVRNIGNRTFFRRDGQWVDSQVTKEQQQNARRVKQFSDEYFELARTQGRRLSQYLVFDEPVLLNFDNQVYLIEP
jgi:Ca-activated chloride channel family protein